MSARPVPLASLALFTRQLSVMIDAGLPLVQCLDILERQEPHRGFAASIRRLRKDVEGGAALADAMKRHPAVFDALYSNLVAAGEAGGILDSILTRLAAHIEKNLKLKRAVKSALMYPAAVLTVAAVVVAAILWKVIPTFAGLFQGLGAQLPLPTRIVIAASDGIVAYGWLFIGAVLAGPVLVRRYRASADGRRAIDGMLLRLPVVGSILRKAAIARFSRTLSTLLTAGVPILQGLDITARSAGNVIVERAILHTRSAIERGQTIAAPLGATGVFPSMVVQLVNVGESTGVLDDMLAKIADFYEEEVEVDVAGLMTLLEPALVVFLGVVVGALVVAMYLPIFDLINRVG